MIAVLLERAGDSYCVARECPTFMPGVDHFPLFAVWDLGDPEVADTLDAIQNSRSSSRNSEAK